MKAEIKDAVARFILENYEECRGYTVDYSSFTQLGLTKEEATKALRRLHQLGLLSQLGINRISVFLAVSPALEEFIESGGYTLQQKMLELNQQKLELSLLYLQTQIKECEKANATLFNNLASGFNNVLNVLGVGLKYAI